jgi:hypothetical protein
VSYYRALACELRRRGCPAKEVAKTLEEVRLHSLDSGSSPAEIFGTPKTFAGSFAEGPYPSAGQGVFYAFVVLGVIQVVVQIVVAKSLGLDPDTGLVPWMFPIVLALSAVGYGVGLALDRRLPRAFKE